MIAINAPFANPNTILLLASPEMANLQEPVDKIEYSETMNGTPYSYIHKGNVSKLRYAFRDVGRGKMLEVQEFFIAFSGSKALLTDHNGDQWQVAIEDDSFDVIHEAKSNSSGGPLEEAGSFSLNFLAKVA